jgi:hypothetical protein
MEEKFITWGELCVAIGKCSEKKLLTTPVRKSPIHDPLPPFITTRTIISFRKIEDKDGMD